MIRSQSKKIHEISEAFKPITYTLWPEGTMAEKHPPKKEDYENAKKKIKELTGLGITDFKKRPKAFVSVADKIVRQEVGIGNNYVLKEHIPALKKRIQDNHLFDFWVQNLGYLCVDTPKKSDHHKLCFVHIVDSKNDKVGYIFSKPMVASPYNVLKKSKNLRKYLKPNPYDSNLGGFFAKWLMDDKKIPLLTDTEQVAAIIGDVVGARGVDTVRKGEDMTGKCENDGVYAFNDFKSHNDSVLFSFGSTAEADKAFPTILDSWEVANNNPDLVDELVEMRNKMYYADDILVKDDIGYAWANHTLNSNKKVFEENLARVSSEIDEGRFGDLPIYRDIAINVMYEPVSKKIDAEIERRNNEYMKKFVEFHEMAVGKYDISKENVGKIIKHIDKPKHLR